jgi:hypothetical protein
LKVRYRSDHGVLFRRNLAAFAAVALPGLLALAAAAFVLGSGSEPAWLPLVSLAIMGSWLGGGIVYSMNAWPIEQRGALEVERRGISIDGELVVPSEQIVSAAFAKVAGTKPVVQLKLRGQPLLRWLRVAGEAEAREVVEALELDAAHTRATFILPWGPFRWGVAYVFYMFLWLAAPFVLVAGMLLSRGYGGMSPLGSAVMAALGACLVGGYWLTWWRSRQHVTIGADGVLVTQWGRTRFVGYRDIVGIHQRPGPMVRGMRAASEAFDLELGSGERIGFNTERARRRLGLFEGDVVAQRIREAMALHGRGEETAEPHARLPARLADLRRLGGQANIDMRTAPTDVDGLWRIVEDPAARPRDRAGAAAALSGARDPATQSRLRDTADTIAMPLLSAAIHAAAEGADADLEAALAELDEEPAKRRS